MNMDAMLNEVSDHVLGAINAVDTRLVLIVSFIVFLRLTLQIIIAREARG